MSFNVKGYLVDIDKEIIEHRQEIAKRRLRISELEDARVLMMQREEYRAAMNGEASPFGTIDGGEIAVRERQLMLMDEGVLSKAAKTGMLPSPGTNKSGNMRGMNVTKGKGSRPRGSGGRNMDPGSDMGRMRDRILKVLGETEDPMTGKELGNYLGLPVHDDGRKPLQNALYNMRVRGQLHRDGEHRYSLPRPRSTPNGLAQ